MVRPKKLQRKLESLMRKVESRLERGRPVEHGVITQLEGFAPHNREVKSLLSRVRKSSRTHPSKASGPPSRPLTKREKRLLRKNEQSTHIVQALPTRKVGGRPADVQRFKVLIEEAKSLRNSGQGLPGVLRQRLRRAAGDDENCKRILDNFDKPNMLPKPNEVLQWHILPPEAGLRSILRQCARRSREAPVDEARIRFMYAQGADKIAVGRYSFDEYIAFVFTRKQLAILESPNLGNATYVLRGKWRELSRETKRRLTTEIGPPLVERIIHREQWRLHVLAVLR